MSRRISQNVSLTPELGRFIQAEVASGRYQTASEVIRDGLRLLQERASTHPVPVNRTTGSDNDGQ